MKTYEVTQCSEALVTVKVRARNTEEANDKAIERIASLLAGIERRYKTVNFGDLSDDYLPARD